MVLGRLFRGKDASGAPVSSPRGTLEPGTLVDGRYRLEAMIGAGGMGYVVVAHHLTLGRRVAIKFIRPEWGIPEEDAAREIQRFEREARAAAMLRGEHVARVIDVGQWEGIPFIVLEYLEGEDLSKRLRKEGPLSPQKAAAFVMQACEGMAEAHAMGIVHRDLKPSNLFISKGIDDEPVVKILDFGVAKLTPPGLEYSESFTSTSSLLGSPHYMSPEQLQDAKNVGPLTDVWSLGVILYEAVAGRKPFEGDGLPALMFNIVDCMVDPLEKWVPDLPAAYGEAVRACLRLKGERLESVVALARMLQPVVGAHSLERMSRIEAISVKALSTSAGYSKGLVPREGSLSIPSKCGDSATLESWQKAAVVPEGMKRLSQGVGILVLGLAVGLVGLLGAYRLLGDQDRAVSASMGIPKGLGGRPPALESVQPLSTGANSTTPEAVADRNPALDPASSSEGPVDPPNSEGPPSPTSSASSRGASSVPPNPPTTSGRPPETRKRRTTDALPSSRK